MNGSSIIFIGNDNSKFVPSDRFQSKYLVHFQISPLEIPERILVSLIPPIGRFCRVPVDLVGPSLALLFMAALLHYGHAYKLASAASSASPTEILLFYSSLMPILSYLLSKIGKSKIAFLELVSLLGYSMFGHVFTIALSLICYQEKSNWFFFFCFFIFGGLSALRILLVLLASIPLPIARLIVCSLIATSHLLFLIFIHFTYMHRTFVYGNSVN